MKITGIKVRQVEVPLVEPFRISLGVITHSRSVIVSVETDEGLVGYGEGAPAILITGESLSGTSDVIREMERDLSGVYKLLGGYRNYIETDMTVGIDTPEVMAAKARQYVTDGFDTIKTKVGTSFAEDIARVKAIREAVGDDVKIRVDANQAWTAKEAVRLIKRLNEYNLELVEQPVAYHDIAGLEYVTKHSDVPIMSDESCFNSKDALRLVERRAIDYLNIKLMKCGGIREALKINAICEAAGIEVMLGCMVEESNLGITAAASLGAATRNITRADLDATFNMTERPFKGGIYVEDTKKLVLPDVPGFGFIGFDNE